jgi:D-arabinose 1-dehydrogenase-like Zn-dependent alcohol dehydrogenase
MSAQESNPKTIPLALPAEAYARMMEGKARFRMVLVTFQ